MTTELTLPHHALVLSEVASTIIGEIRPRLVQAALSGERGERANRRHADNFLSTHDLWMHQRYKELFKGRLGSFVYASEEAEPEVVGSDPDPDLCVLVDPLDTSELAVRALNGYTHVLLYSRALARPIAAVVGDIYHHLQLYVAARGDHSDHAWVLTADGQVNPITTASTSTVSQVLLTNYLMRPVERFRPLSRQTALIEALGAPDEEGRSRGRIGVDFGSIGLCHVAAGFTDAMIEFAKGFAIWDLSPGHYILHAAGGVVLDLQGNVLPLDYGLDSISSITAAMNGRQKFVAAGSLPLARDLLGLLNVDNL